MAPTRVAVINRNFWRWFYKMTPAQRERFRNGGMAVKPPEGFCNRKRDAPSLRAEHPGEVVIAKEGDMTDRRSKDRVHFKLKAHFNSDRHKIATLLERAFGIYDAKVAYALIENEGTIICRPSQFARFLIWRDEAGMRNGFKELEAKLVPAVQPLQVIDVSDNPARSCD